MSSRDFEKISWWLMGEVTQNFGDYLSYIISKSIFVQPVRNHCSYRMLGSTLSDWDINEDLVRVGASRDQTIAAWCCGARNESALSEDTRKRIVTYGVRGPLTRNVLGLPLDTPLGDPGLIMPIIYSPSAQDQYKGKNICVPHFLDTLGDAELITRTGADLVLRPNIERTERAVFEFIDAIASASFVLSGSLHAAIVACAYDVPFGYLDTGYLDIAFKWRDFSALMGIATSFCDRVIDAKVIYEQVNRPRLRKPPLLPMLAVAPFSVKLEFILKAFHYDALNHGSMLHQYSEQLTTLLKQRHYSLLDPQDIEVRVTEHSVSPAEEVIPQAAEPQAVDATTPEHPREDPDDLSPRDKLAVSIAAGATVLEETSPN